MKVIGYVRVSTKKQGESGLGEDAQHQYLDMACKQNGWELLETFQDTVSGAVSPMDRPALKKALEACKKQKAVLLVAKLDRLSRSVLHIAQLMETVDFKVCTMPHADKFQLHLYAALAEQERDFISQRTKEALASLKRNAEGGNTEAQVKVQNRAEKLALGHKTGLPAAHKQRAINADSRAKELEDSLRACLQRGLKTYQGIADCLNNKGVTTSRGSLFQPMTVKRVMERLQLTF
ncbi:recombinase family protein [Pseudomonas luteola]|uniref:recombinase family protein n=1 Tax=Pseudomonas luteola TaxID=47886 RepID=UPI000F793DB9|nr:recombinase family protein [Pseudomonas luteola]RRW45085.1 recombinase family protein [Pseudomonas luteola]